MEPAEGQQNVLLVNQPIYDCHKEVFGFELLYPGSSDLTSDASGHDSAAISEALLNFATGIAEQVDIYSRPMLVRLPDSLLYSDSFLASLSQQIVIAVSPQIQKHDLLVNKIEKWRSYGFRFVLDGFDFSPRHRELFPLFDYVKIDTNQFPPQSLNDLTENAPALIVKHIESEEAFRAYRDQGATLFQGYFLAQPVTVQGRSLRNRVNRSISLTRTITHPDAEIEELVEAVSADPSLATQMLKIINSPLCGLKRPVKSLRDAVVYLGLGQVRKWIMIMTMMNTGVVDSGTIRLVLTRAKTCERYATLGSSANPDQAFLTGLVSGVDLLFAIEPEVFLKQVTLDADIETAILKHQGELGKVLTASLEIERLVMQSETAIAETAEDNTLVAYTEASAWAEKVLSILPYE